jgi:hypothetical protein
VINGGGRRKACGLSVRPRPLTVAVWLKSNARVDGDEVSDLGQEEVSMGSGPLIDQATAVYVAPKGMMRSGFLLRRSFGLGSKLDLVA